MLQTLRTETMAIIFSTHDGQLANELADRVLYLSDGALSPRQLEYATVNRYSKVLGWGEAEAPLWIKKVDGIVEIAWGDKEVMVTVDENLRNQTLLDAIRHGLSVLKVERVKTDE
jgi:energy-coupling factor transporter ATP-binding protein EcfA2